MIEVELKFKANHKDLEKRILEKAAIFLIDEINEDQYYNHPCKNFIETDEVLRLRRVNEKIEITYKGALLDKRSKSRVEQNIPISDYEEMETLFLNLGFVRSGYVKKKRRKYKIRDITITLDFIFNLGEYIELEIDIINESDYDTALLELRKLCDDLGLDINQQILKSYLYLLENKNESK